MELAEPEAEEDPDPASHRDSSAQDELAREELREELEDEIREELEEEIREELQEEVRKRLEEVEAELAGEVKDEDFAEMERQCNARVEAERERCAEALRKLAKVQEQAELAAGAAATQAQEAIDDAARLEAELEEAQEALRLAEATPARLEEIPELQTLVRTKSAVVDAVRSIVDDAEEVFEENEALLDVLDEIRAVAPRRTSSSETKSGGEADLQALVLLNDDIVARQRLELEESRAKMEEMQKTIVSLRWRQTMRATPSSSSPPLASSAPSDETQIKNARMYESQIETLQQENKDLHDQVVRENREAMVTPNLPASIFTPRSNPPSMSHAARQVPTT